MSTERIRELRQRAGRARELALTVLDIQVAANLKRHAKELDAEASALEAQILPPAAMDTTSQEPSTGPEAIAALKPEPEPEPDKSGGQGSN